MKKNFTKTFLTQKMKKRKICFPKNFILLLLFSILDIFFKKKIVLFLYRSYKAILNIDPMFTIFYILVGAVINPM
jgi:hypothetical protein